LIACFKNIFDSLLFNNGQQFGSRQSVGLATVNGELRLETTKAVALAGVKQYAQQR
jgi:hypothetical protein